MSLIEQTLSKMRSEFAEILATNIAKSTIHYEVDRTSTKDTTDLIWEDTAFVGITEDSDITNILDNPSFFADVVWSKGTGWSIVAGSGAQCDGTQTGSTKLKQTGVITAYNLYRIKIDYIKVAGDFWVVLEGNLNSSSGVISGDEDCDIVLRAFSDGDFSIVGDADMRVTVSNVKVQLVDPVDKTKYDAVAYCPYNYDVEIGEYLEVDSILYLVYKIEANLDHKKVFCLHL